MSNFKLGPARTRDGRAAFIVAVRSALMECWEWPLDVMIELAPGKWSAHGRWEGGHVQSCGEVDPRDILPNNEPEWRYATLAMHENGQLYWMHGSDKRTFRNAALVIRYTDGVAVDGALEAEIAWRRGQDDD